MRSSYREEDVILLLKDITGLVEPQPTEERERLIQSGKHYCEMLPLEYVPGEKYMEAYREALKNYAKPVALALGVLADKILAKRGNDVVLVSLARAGIPVGILLKRYIRAKYHLEVKHYSVSIIRGKGIDDNAMKYLLQHYSAKSLLFVDGWIGKGAILGELEKAVAVYEGVSPELAVVADPAYITELYGTREDILIPSACLNSTVSGLVSRTFLREDIIGKEDYHGAVYYGEWEASDLSYDFIHTIEAEFELEIPESRGRADNAHSAGEGEDISCGLSAGIALEADERKAADSGAVGLDEVREIAAEYGIEDINFVKPGIGETTRVLLRRVPWKILIKSGCGNAPELNHIRRLAQEKGVPVEEYPLVHYKTCGLIKKLERV